MKCRRLQIEPAVDDDTTLIFRVPGTFAYRVLVGNHVRIECNPTTEVVTGVTLLAPVPDADLEPNAIEV